MNIDYTRMERIFNQYALNQVKTILNMYGDKLPISLIETFSNLVDTNKMVIVDSPNTKDEEKFGKNIPAAHGPRGKNDGYIHVYPYKYTEPFTNHPLTDDEIISRYLDEAIILHEIYHYIYKLDIKKENGTKEEVDFGHFMTEGMVQLKTEEHCKKRFESVEYRKNVELAKKAYIVFEEIGCEDLLLKNNFRDACEIANIDYEYFLNEYIEILNFEKELEEIIQEAAKDINMNEERLKTGYKRKTIEESIVQIKKDIAEYIPDKKEYYYEKIEKLENKKDLHL